MSLQESYLKIRDLTVKICHPLKTEDYVVQPVTDVSPPKWHLGHTTWFFETFVLQPFFDEYKIFHSDFAYIFNSYYEAAGTRILRSNRGNLTRPVVDEVYAYRHYVDEAMQRLLDTELVNNPEVINRIELGLNHEQQHQELLWTDIKYILGHNPLFPAYDTAFSWNSGAENSPADEWVSMERGLYEIGYRIGDFCYDNEMKCHPVHLDNYSISSRWVSNREFIESGAYSDFRYWHSEGWEWVKQLEIRAPMYWYRVGGEWCEFTLSGLHPVDPEEPVSHISYYEAAAFAAWKECRLPTEFEWEVAANRFSWGQRWEWTESAYLPYPGFAKADGAIGEYNGKFMVNQKVLRGASEATSPGHSRPTYRNFFHPHLRWQFTGIRLARP